MLTMGTNRRSKGMGGGDCSSVENTTGSLMLRRANSGDRPESGKEAALTCEDAMQTEFWD